MATLQVSYFRDIYNTNKVYAIKKSKHGHYFVNQFSGVKKLYNAFKRVSVKVVRSLQESSRPCNKPAAGVINNMLQQVLAAHNVENNINACNMYRELVVKAYRLALKRDYFEAWEWLADQCNQYGYDFPACKEALDVYGDL